MSTEYICTYKPLAIWLGAFVASMAALPLSLAWFVPGNVLTCAMLGCIYLGLLALFILIHRGGYVYWLSGGPSFEEARDAGEASRREYAWAHLKRFLAAGAVIVPWLVLTSVFHWPVWLDIVVFGALIVGVAASANRIRFADSKEETR